MRRSRTGFTLLEIVLVLAIVVALASLVLTSWSGELDEAAMIAAADDVRALLARTRLAAIETGRLHQVVCRADGRYSAGPQAPGEEQEGEDRWSEDEEPKVKAWTQDGRLPEGVRFARIQLADQPASDDEEAVENDEIDTGSDAEAPDFPPLLCHPDGTTSDATIRLTGRQGRNAEIKLRGLIGQALLVRERVATGDTLY